MSTNTTTVKLTRREVRFRLHDRPAVIYLRTPPSNGPKLDWGNGRDQWDGARRR
jgi:hypothetical protein